MFSEEGYRALRTGAGVIRRGDRTVLTVTGADRLTWLQGLVTNDVLALPAGGVCDAAYLTPQGRMITDLRVVNLPDRTLLDVPAPLAASLQARLDALLFSEDAQIVDRSSEGSLVDVHGPAAPAIVDGLDVFRHDVFHVPGFSAWIANRDVEAFIATAATRGATPTTLETLDVVRIEAGRPAFLIDMDEHTIPLEAGLEDRAISFTKGCYVGQEVIVRVMHRGGGRVARRLVGLTMSVPHVARAGDVVRSADREIGKITSAAWSPTLERAIALGYLHRDFVGVGTAVDIHSSAGVAAAHVTALPFVA